MAVNIVWRKDQLVQVTNNGSIRERKILGYPMEDSPLKAYSSLFYWSHLVSEYGCTINDKPIIGFEIFTYVIRGVYESYHKANDTWNILNQGDIEIIQAGKGTKYTEKLHPNSEVLKIWFDPGFNLHRRMNPQQTSYENSKLPHSTLKNRTTTFINGANTTEKLFTKNVSIFIEQLQPGRHIIKNELDFTLSAYIIEGYIDIHNVTLCNNDFFSLENTQELPIQALSDCKLMIISSPLKPEYQMYREMYV
jgi:quercetin 2,3-dioxygenase